MTRTSAILSGLLLGAVAGLLALYVIIKLLPTPETEEVIDAEAAEEILAEAPILADDATDEAEPREGVLTVDVTIYERAQTKSALIAARQGKIVWVDSPIERARQLVQLVLRGLSEKDALSPAPKGLDYHEVHIDDRRIAWIDLRGEGVVKLAGSDIEEALVACLSRTLVENMEEVERVGFLIDGEPRRTLAGHVDLTRTYDGSLWEVEEDDSERPGELIAHGIHSQRAVDRAVSRS